MTGFEIPLLMLAAGGAVAGAGVAAYGQYQQGKQAEAAGKVNAAIAQREADQQQAAGRLEAERIRRERIRLTATQQAGYAKSGVTSEGTPLLVMIQSAAEEELNASMAQYNAGIGAMRSESEAAIYRQRGKDARKAGIIGAGSTLLGGISDAAYMRVAGKTGGGTGTKAAPMKETYKTSPWRTTRNFLP